MTPARPLLLACLAASLAAPCSEAQSRLGSTPRIAFIFYGNITDGGWTQTQERAREQLEARFGVRIPYVQRVPETTEQVSRAIELFVRHGTRLVIGGSYAYSEAFASAARAHPEVNFIDIAGTRAAPNLESFYIRAQEGWYLAGMAAGLSSKTGLIGFVGAVPIAETLVAANGYARGAQAVNPRIRVKVSFTNSWDDPVREGQFATAMIEQGVDVLAAALDSPAGVLAAERAGIRTIGSEDDMAAAAPKGMLTCVVLHWDRRLIPMVQAMQAGSWTSGGTPLYGISSGLIDITPLAHMPAAQADRVMAARQAIIDGTLDPLGGPLRAQDGTLRLAQGQHLTDRQLDAMDFLVAGVEGSRK